MKSTISINKKILVTGAILGMLSVLIGAFAAHGLKPKISLESMSSFETGVRYQIYHAFLLLFLGVIDSLTEKVKKSIFYLVLFGVLLFSFSIYALATNTLTPFNFKVIGFLTPIGGLAFISAWLLLIVNFFKLKLN